MTLILLWVVGSGDLQHVKKGGEVGGYRDGVTPIRHNICGRLFDPTQHEELDAALCCGVESVGRRSRLLVSSNTRRYHTRSLPVVVWSALVHLVSISNPSL